MYSDTITPALMWANSLTRDPWFWPFVVVLAMWILGVRTMLRIAIRGGGKSL